MKSPYTVRQVAEQLGVHPDHVRRLIHNGELLAFDIAVGKDRPCYRVTPEALAGFIARRSVAPPPPRPLRRKNIPFERII
jgi:excisionase family DNA binding protein